MINAQEWLDTNHPTKEERKNIIILDLKGKDLEGELDLNDFVSLEKLDCSDNYLTGLNISSSKSEKITELFMVNNNFPRQGLSLFSRFKNLKRLWIGNNNKTIVEKNVYYNRFTGSLRPLENLNKLEELNISNTDIDSDLEYLPESLERIVYLSKNERSKKAKSNDLLEDLQPYFQQISVDSYFNMVEWRKEIFFPYYAQVLELRKENEEQKNEITDLREKIEQQIKLKISGELEITLNKHQESNQIIEEQLAVKQRETEKLQIKYYFYEQFFNNSLENKKTKLGQLNTEIKNKLNEAEQEWLDTYLEIQKEAENSDLLRKQLIRAKGVLTKKIKEKELQNLVDKQAKIAQLESRLNNLQTQEQQYLENQERVISTYFSKEEKDVDIQNKYLDTLARLFTSNETCVAVCFHQGRLFVASKWESPKYARVYLKSLREFVNNQSTENYERLMRLSVEQICAINTTANTLDSSNVTREEVNEKSLDNFLEIARKYKNNLQFNWEEFQKEADKLFLEINQLKENEKNSKANKRWNYLVHWHDTGEIVKAIKNEKLDKEIIKGIRENNNIEYVEVDPESESKNLHAEMKIIDKMWKEFGEEEIQKPRYIGLTKLTCDDCYATISILNKNYQWKVCGRHGSSNEYTRDWIAPSIMKEREEEIRKWKEKNRIAKIKETTSEIPEKLVNMVQLLREIQTQEQQVQVEQPPYGIPGSSK